MRRDGFTLVETIIASAVIVFGVLGILSLSTTSIVVTQVTEAEFMASLFAREGIETVRAIRDSNWLKYDTDSTTAWNATLASGTDYTAILQDPVNASFLDFSTDALDDECVGASSVTYTCASLWFNPETQTYYQTNSTAFDPRASTAQATAYRRMITLNPICRDTSTESSESIVSSGSTCSGSETQVGIDVIVRVQYPSKGTPSIYILEEHLYDWKF